MVNLLLTAVIGDVVLLLSVPTAVECNITLATSNASYTRCIVGKEYYQSDLNRCRKCPKCRKAAAFQSYPITVSDVYGASDCYPCYCKPEVKVYNPETGRCNRCPMCTENGKLNKTVVIPIDPYKGGLDCYQCVCNPGHFSNILTHYQCVECQDCLYEKRKLSVHCSKEADAQCGGCIEGFMEPRLTGSACVKNTSESSGNILHQTTTEKTLINVKSHELPLHGQKSQTIIVVLLILSVFIALFILYLVYRMIQKPCCPNHHNPVSASISNTTVSASSLKTDVNETVKTEIPLLNNAELEGSNTLAENDGYNSHRYIMVGENNTIIINGGLGDLKLS